MRTRAHARATSEGARSAGFALIVVLLVLLALLVLSAPFLYSARNADKASAQLSDRVATRVALDGAARHARAVLGATHPALDATPYQDSLDEIEVDNRFAEGFLDANDPAGMMWDLELADVAGKIDLDSAPPQVIANLTGAGARFAKVVAADEKSLALSATRGLAPDGFVWAGAELVHYSKIEDNAFVEFERGVLGPLKGKEWFGGPRPPSEHAAGAPVIDQRAFAPALWRMKSSDGRLRSFASMEELRQASAFALAAALATRPAEGGSVLGLDDAFLRPLFAHGSVHGRIKAGSRWQRAVRLAAPVKGGVDGRIQVDHPRWFSPGSTIEISDGVSTELALVMEVERNGRIVLDRVLANDYREYGAIVRVQARRPVNLNTAAPAVLQALFTNLQITGRNSRITRDEAESLAELVVESRPFDGHEDFLRRVVLPAAGLERLPADADVHPDMLASGAGFIDALDALALYQNGLNANDGGLAYSTLPYAYTTRDVYALELRATLNAPSGVSRFSLVREQVDVITPQRELLALWARQEDFDEALRLDLEAPWWMSAPHATSRWDEGSVPPSRLLAHMGTQANGQFLPGLTEMPSSAEPPPPPERVFASREDTAWIQLYPAYTYGIGIREGRLIHFSHETRDHEGRYLPDETVEHPSDDKLVQWTDPAAPLLRPLSLQLWVKPRSLDDGTLLDVVGTDPLRDRVSLLFETNAAGERELVLRVLDGVGDDQQTAFPEIAEVRYSTNVTALSPGFPADRWHHVDIDVRGNRPDQLQMLVNGLAHGVRTFGMSRLTGGISAASDEIAVESTEGFPDTCVVRIGNELIEVSKSGSTAFTAQRQETGELAGFGGRQAREPYDSLATPPIDGVLNAPADLATLSVIHAANTPVSLYGYSGLLTSNVPVGDSLTSSDLGPFRVARLIGVVGGQTPQGDPIIPDGAGPFSTTPLGLGAPLSTVTDLVLASADDPERPPEDFMPAFDPNGGYAAIVQINWNFDGFEKHTVDGVPLGGVEVIRYSGWDGTSLKLAARGDQVTELPNLQLGVTNLVGGKRTFVTEWNGMTTTTGIEIVSLLSWQAYVVPISLGVPGATLLDYLAAKAGESRFAQFTRVDDAENTEWVRYDWFEEQRDQLVRDDPEALVEAYNLVVGGQRGTIDGGTPEDGAPAGAGSNDSVEPAAVVVVDPEPAPLAAAPVSAAAAAPQSFGSQWDPRIGKNENEDFPLSSAIASALQFRGVFGTYTHAQPAGTLILPVFNTAYTGPSGGRPGRLDYAFLVDGDPTDPGLPVRVHRAHIPSPLNQYMSWDQAGGSEGQPTVVVGGQLERVEDGQVLNKTYVALQTVSPRPMVPGTSGAASSAGSSSGAVATADSRLYARLVCFPSGERPRGVSSVAIGGGANGRGGTVPPSVVDEILFGDADFGRATVPTDAEAYSGASLIARDLVDDAELDFKVEPAQVRIAFGESYGPVANPQAPAPNPFLGELPADAGLLRIGEEIVCYSRVDATNGEVTIAQNGRGLLGTRAQPHDHSEPILYLEQFPVSVLTAGVSATDSSFPLASSDEFPDEGTVLVGSELIHYTRRRGTVLEMPRASAVPGKMDEDGEGLFRGRFGTTAAAHATGEPVILFPFRYWDRWAPRADAPELAYFQFAIDQPAAFWQSSFFVKEDGEASQIGVLQRSDPDAPWDGDFDNDARLKLYYEGLANDGTPWPIGTQSDRIDWRVFVQFAPGAFDLVTGQAHGWRETPRLKQIGAFYFGPGAVLESVER